MTEQEKESKLTQSPQLHPALEDTPRLTQPLAVEPILVPSEAFNFSPFHSDFASFHEGYVRHYIALADAKAGLIFTLAAGVVGYLLNMETLQSTLLNPACTCKFFVSLLTLGFIGTTAILAFLVVAPRLSAPSKESIVFFGSVAGRETADDYLKDVAASNDDDLTKARLKHCFDTSKICARKYDLLKKSIWLLLPSMALTLLVILLH